MKKETVEMWIKSHMITKLEAYGLAWYAAARHTSIDSVEKHNKKGVLITIGDEPVLENIPKHDLKELFGEAQSNVDVRDILAEVRENWDVYHINVTDYSGSRKNVQNQWQQLLGENFVNTQTPDGKDVPELIAGIVIKSYRNSTPVQVLNEYKVEPTVVEPNVIL